MLAAQRTSIAILLLAGDLLLIATALVVAYWLRFGEFETLFEFGPHRKDHVILAAASAFAWISALWLSRLYRLDLLITRRLLLPRIVVLAPAVGVAVAAALFLFQAKFASRLVFGYSLAGAAIGTWLCRRTVLGIRRHLSKRPGLGVVIVGAGELGRELGEYLGASPELGYRLVGHIARRNQEALVPIIGTEDDLADVLDREIVDQVVIAAPITEIGNAERIIQTCDEIGIDVSVAAVGLGPRVASVSVDELGGTQLLRLASSPQFRAAMVGKRIFDVIAASVLLVLAVPVLIISALLVKFGSRGPVLFIQDRVGLNGRTFPFLKFRTMVDGAHELRENLQSDVAGPAFKMRRDPRVTRIGGFLRRYSVDELPQLLNVIAGNMSLVGPRPPLPEEVAKYDRWQLRRLSVRPGITCTWQVSGRSEIGFEEWMKLDLAYIDNWSPWLDLKILARTLPAVLSRRGAA